MKFEITENSEQLVIKQTSSSVWMNMGEEVLGLFVSFTVFIFPYDQLVALNKYLWIIYFVPVFPAILVFRTSITLGNRMIFELDKRRNSLIRNGKVIDQLSNIKYVEWNIDSAIDHVESYLELRSSKNRRHRISTTMSFMNKEHAELGKTLARFLKAEFHNNNPLEKEVLYYGQNNVNENDLKFIENR